MDKEKFKKKIGHMAVITVTILMLAASEYAINTRKDDNGDEKPYESSEFDGESGAVSPDDNDPVAYELDSQISELEDIYNIAAISEDMDSDPMTAYLTFDDGPSYLTPKVLDVLDEYGVKATFFVTYQPDYEDIYREIINRGHVIGVHSASHEYDEIYSSFENWLADFTKMYDYIVEVTGTEPKVYRFPGGSCGIPCKSNPDMRAEAKAYLENIGVSYFDWNVECGDGGYVTTNQAYRKVVDNIRDRNLPVILMHDGVKKETTLEALPDTLNQLISWGYAFDTLSPSVPAIRQGSSWDYSLKKSE